MSASADWYPDTNVASGERYWDGEKWTDQRRAKQAPVLAAAKPVAGWYDDPNLVGTRRYWDGQRWTDRRQEKTQASSAVPSGGSTSFWRRPLSLGGAVAVVVLAIWLLYGSGRAVWSGTAVDADVMAAIIELELSAKGMADPTLTCSPVDGAVQQGDSTVCSGETGEGSPVTIRVTFNSDGSFIWETR